MKLKKLLKSGALGNVDFHKTELEWIEKALLRMLPRARFGGVLLTDLDFGPLLAGAFLALSFAMFIYIISSGTVSSMNQRSLSAYFVQDDNLNCTEILRSSQQSIEGGWNGVWSTDPESDDSKMIFFLEFYGSNQIDSKMYTRAISSMADDLSKYGAIGATKNSLWSFLILCTYVYEDKNSNTALFFSAQTPFFLNTLSQKAVIANKKSVCLGLDGQNKFLYGDYDPSRAALDLHIPLELNKESIDSDIKPRFRPETCPQHGNWTNYAFNPGSGGTTTADYALLSFDTRSTFLAVALNTGLAGLDLLNQQTNKYLQSKGLFAVTDPYYTAPPMEPIYCLDQSHPLYASRMPQADVWKKFRHKPQVCFMTSTVSNNALQLFYPMVTQMLTVRDSENKAIQPYRMRMCRCLKDNTNDINDNLNIDCNKLSFYFGYFYATSDIDPITYQYQPGTNTINFGIQMLQRLVNCIQADKTNYDTNFFDSFTNVFSATYVLSRYTRYTSSEALYRDQLNQAFSELSSIDMSMVYFRSLQWISRVNFFTPLNVHGVQIQDLRQGDEVTYMDLPGFHLTATMCQDFISAKSAMEKFAKTPPIDLTEKYYTCTKTLKYALQTSMGTAFAATSLFFNIAWALTGLIAMWIYRKMAVGSASRTLFGAETKLSLQEALDDMKAENLRNVLESLRVRLDRLDGKNSLDQAAIDKFHLLQDSTVDPATAPRSEALSWLIDEIAIQGEKVSKDRAPHPKDGDPDSNRQFIPAPLHDPRRRESQRRERDSIPTRQRTGDDDVEFQGSPIIPPLRRSMSIQAGPQLHAHPLGSSTPRASMHERRSSRSLRAPHGQEDIWEEHGRL